MIDRRMRLLTAALLIAVPLLFNVCFMLLQASFDYPDILRHPADEVLRRFASGGTQLIALWYLFALTPALFLPAAILLRRACGRDAGGWLDFAIPLAIASSLVQLFGLLRWPFLVPGLARVYLDPATDEATRAATLVVFQAAHQYFGVAVGEHLGYLFTGAWTLAIAAAMLRSTLFRPWLGWIGLLAAVAVLAGMLEPAGVEIAGAINAVGYIVWSLWLIGAGISLALARPRPAEQAAPLSPAPMPL